MNLLVTGCFGFIGYNFINFLNNHHKNEFNLIGIDALLSTTSKKNYNEFKSEKGFIFFENDINNIQEIEYLNKNKINFIINFAAESHVDNSITNPESFIHSNVSGANAILTYAVKNEVENILHISTDEVYGSAKDHFFKEEEILNPSSPYSASKASAEMVCNAFKKTWQRLMKRCGFTDLRFHDLRHEATSRLFEKGLNVMEVASITGHKDVRMLYRYTHPRAEILVKKLQ